MSEEQPTNSTGAGSTDRSAWTAMAHGARQRCPACGRGRLFRAFLKVDDRCPQCAEELSHHRADDAPAYFTMVIVGHVVVGGVLILERAYEPDFWAHALLWLPVTVISSLLLLPRVKGALVGLQWALRMHGFAATPHVEPDRRR